MKWAVVTLLALSGCALPVISVKVTCLPMPNYTDQQKAAIKAAYDAQPVDSPLRGAVQDLLQLRNENRACQGT